MELVDSIKFVATTIIVYLLTIFILMKFTGSKFVSTVDIVQSVLMTIGALSFVYSYQQARTAKIDRIEKIATDVPKQWSEVLIYIKENKQLSPSLKNWILTGNDSNISNSTLNMEDLNFIEFVINKCYLIWLLMVESAIATPESTVEDYETFFKNAKTTDRDLMKNILLLIGGVCKPKFIHEHLRRESSFYPKGFMNFIIFSVKNTSS